MVTAEFNPMGPGMLGNPYAMYRALREQAPIYWSPMMEAWIFTRYDDVDFILADPRFSADRSRGRNRFSEMVAAQEQEFGPFSRVQTMLSSDPPDHTRLRRLVSKAFTPRAVENLRPRIHEIVDQLLDSAEKMGEFDLVNEIAYPLPVIVIAEMLGVPPEDRPSFKRWSTDVVQTLGGPFTPQDVFDKARVSLEELATYLRDFIADRRAKPREDLISWLVAAEDQGNILSEDEIFATTILLLIAGNETTTHLIGSGMLALFRNPEEMQRLRDDPSLLPSAVEELLRYTGPVHLTGRVPKEPLEVGGQPVEEGHVCIALLAAANRDPSHYTDPERLDVARNPTDHLGLGDGIHFCLGAPLARAEAQIAIGAILQRFPKLTCRDLDPEWGGTFIIRGVKTLPVSV
jgi:cytochrome P450